MPYQHKRLKIERTQKYEKKEQEIWKGRYQTNAPQTENGSINSGHKTNSSYLEMGTPLLSVICGCDLQCFARKTRLLFSCKHQQVTFTYISSLRVVESTNDVAGSREVYLQSGDWCNIRQQRSVEGCQREIPMTQRWPQAWHLWPTFAPLTVTAPVAHRKRPFTYFASMIAITAQWCHPYWSDEEWPVVFISWRSCASSLCLNWSKLFSKAFFELESTVLLRYFSSRSTDPILNIHPRSVSLCYETRARSNAQIFSATARTLTLSF